MGIKVKKANERKVDYKAIAEAYVNDPNATQKDIAKQFGVSVPIVRKALYVEGVLEFTDEQIEKIKKALDLWINKGYSKPKAAKEAGIHINLLDAYCLRHNIQHDVKKMVKHSDIFNDRYLDNIDTPEKAIVLGLLYSDGWITTRKVCFELKDKDKHVIEWFAKQFDYPLDKIREKHVEGHKIKGKEIPAYTTYVIQMISPYLYQLLQEKYGFTRNKTYSSKTPFDSIPDEYIAPFIYGVFLGDGWKYYHLEGKRTIYGVCFGNKEAAEKAKEVLIHKLGIQCGIQRDTTNSEHDYRVMIRQKHSVLRFYNIVIKPYKNIITIWRKCEKPLFE